MIDRKQVQHVATLARLKLSDDEMARFTSQLGAVIDYINQLDEVDTTDVAPMSHPSDLVNVFRDDVTRPSLDRDAALANAPRRRDGFFVVPPVLEWASPEES